MSLFTVEDLGGHADSAGALQGAAHVGAELRDKIARAQALLRHQVPDGDLAVVVDRAMTLLLRELERARFAATSGNVRVLCNRHNAYQAELDFGATYIAARRQGAVSSAAQGRREATGIPP